MFGAKLKNWMENHIGRPKKKPPEKDKAGQNGRGNILESSESLAQSDTGISSGSQQVLSSSVTDHKEGGYCTTTLESDRSGMTHCLTAVSLPSPESAYSTGYSTDGASPGGTGPPEYYINIRTGKHYFPSPAPTPTSPQPNLGFSQLNSGHHCLTTSFLVNDSSAVPPVPSFPSQLSVGSLRPKEDAKTVPCAQRTHFQVSAPGPCNGFPPVLSTFVPGLPAKGVLSNCLDVKPNTLSTSVPSHFELFSFAKSPSKKTPVKSQLSSLKLFLKSPKLDKGKGKVDASKTPSFDSKKTVVSPSKTKKWYKQPFQKFGQKRTDPYENILKNEVKKDIVLDKSVYYVTKDNATASPRQRNRIKTNPWLPTEPMSSQNFHNLQINFSPSLPRNRSCTNTPLQNRKISTKADAMQTRFKEMNARYDESKEYLTNLENIVNSRVGQKLCLELSDHSEEDLTLNEMMGTYNESYVYEKETDILSDSDPTDCEDYVSDSEADNGGDEQDSHDDELDFIDNGSITETDENFPGNTGKCTYHDIYVRKNSFLYKSDRHHSRKDGDGRKSFRKDKENKGKKCKEEKRRRPIRKSLKCDEEDSRKRPDENPKPKVELNENVGGLNLGRVLMHRMMTKNGSKSADGTPVSSRRQDPAKESRETQIGPKKTLEERRAKLNGDLYFVDIEGDKKYTELIREAETIYQTIQNSPIFQNRKKINFSDEKPVAKPDNFAASVDIWKKAEEMCCPTYSLKEKETPTRKSPKHLGLKLAVDETSNLQHLEFGRKTSFKAKSSAHSPLDPLGPTFRNFTVFKPVNIDDEDNKISLSSSEDSEPGKQSKPNLWAVPDTDAKTATTPDSPIVPIAFQSIDLGKPLMPYCPQSEPVKRKIYTCSKTYDKLVKTFETTPKIFEESANERVRHGSLMTKRRPSGAEHKPRGTERGPRNPPPRESYAYGDACYPSRISPRRASMPSNSPSPIPTHRHLLDVDAFR